MQYNIKYIILYYVILYYIASAILYSILYSIFHIWVKYLTNLILQVDFLGWLNILHVPTPVGFSQWRCP